MENAIGIDLGTTFSVVGFFDQEGRCRTIPNSEGDLTTPSVVYFDADQPIVGKEAAKAGMFEPDRCAFLAKRDMGKNHYHREILDQSIPPEVIQAIILKKLREDAQVQLGEIKKAVITVPAYFNEPRRKATQDAGKLAGLDVLDIINEPTAAAIAYGVQEGFLNDHGVASKRELILVYDLGGGTFDATLMEIDGASYRALSTGGDVHLGGIDWDRRIADYAADEFRRQHGFDPRNDSSASQELTREAEDAKRALTARTVTTMHIAHGGKRMRLELNREKLSELTGDLTSRTIFTCKKVLTDAKRTWADVTRVLAVGGSSRMPMVQEALEAESGMSVDRSLAPDEAVAHGAAIYARLKSAGHVDAIANLSVTNVSSHDLGVLGVERATGMPRRKVLISRNTPLPARGTGRFVTRADGQADVAVKVIEGGDASGNHSTPIGRFLVENIPAGTKKGAPVVVQFTYQQDGRLDVSATVSGVEGSGTMSVERATGLSDAEIEMWQGRVERNQVVQQPKTPAARPEPAASPDEPPNPAAAMAGAAAPKSGADEGLSGDHFDAFLDSDETDLLGEDLAADSAAADSELSPPADKTEVIAGATVVAKASDLPTVEVKVDIPATPSKPAGEPGPEDVFDGPLFIEQPKLDAAPEIKAAEITTEAPTPTPAVTPEPITNPQPVVAEQKTAPKESSKAPAETATAKSAIKDKATEEKAPAETSPSADSPVDKVEAADATESESSVFQPSVEAADAPTPDQLGLEDSPREDVALGSLDFLEAEEASKSSEDDNDLQDFFSSLP